MKEEISYTLWRLKDWLSQYIRCSFDVNTYDGKKDRSAVVWIGDDITLSLILFWGWWWEILDWRPGFRDICFGPGRIIFLSKVPTTDKSFCGE